MVGALVSGLSDSGANPGWGAALCFLGKTLYSHSAPFTQVYKWILANMVLRWGRGNLAIDTHLIQTE